MNTLDLKPATGARSKEDKPAKIKGFWALNWLRFFLAIYIVLFHTLKSYPALDGTIFKAMLGLGNMATSTFFVLSGFLLTHAYVVAKDGRQVDKHSFFLARFSTLYPLHIVGLLLAALPVLHTIYVHGGVSVPTELSGTAVRMLGTGELVGAFIMNAALLNAWNPYYLSFNYQSWSLSALACYYLLFPVVALKIYRMKSPALGLVVLGIMFLLPGALADLLQRTDVVTNGLLHRNPIVRLPLFLAGMVLCVAYARGNKQMSVMRLLILSSILFATFCMGTYLQFHESQLHLIRNGLYYPASLAFIWWCVSVKPSSNRMVQYWGERLGAASLPLFLLHGPLFPLFRSSEKFVKALFLTPEMSLSAIVATGKGVAPSVSFYLVHLILLTVVCVFVQERFVLPIQGKIRVLLPKRDKPNLPENKMHASAG